VTSEWVTSESLSIGDDRSVIGWLSEQRLPINHPSITDPHSPITNDSTTEDRTIKNERILKAEVRTPGLQIEDVD
jgi:hypothetical protein